MSLPSLLAAAALASTGVHAANPPSAPKGTITYRWVDEQGVVHYGDQIPPQYSSSERTIVNGQGVPVATLDAQKSPDQLAAAERERAAAIKLKQHDTFLITTYTSVKDIEGLRDSRLEQMRNQRAAGEQYVESLRARLNTLQVRALNFRPYSTRSDARRMPDDLAEDLVRTMSELHAQSAALAIRSQAEATLRAQFQADIERYRELHTLHDR